MVEWMRVGFVHGVMNTDNMSILGETIDYGPYGWLAGYDPNWTPNTTDAGQRRYRYGQQPAIGQWHLMQLANAILPLIEDPKPLEDALSAYVTRYEAGWQNTMTAKLGLKEYNKDIVDRATSNGHDPGLEVAGSAAGLGKYAREPRAPSDGNELSRSRPSRRPDRGDARLA